MANKNKINSAAAKEIAISPVPVVDETVKGNDAAAKKTRIEFSTIIPVIAEISDGNWQQVLGCAVAIPGGVQIEIERTAAKVICETMKAGTLPDNEALKARIPIHINDPYYPEIELHLSLGDVLSCTQRAREAPLRKGARRRRCIHSEDKPKAGCEYCFYRQWKKAIQRIRKDESTK